MRVEIYGDANRKTVSGPTVQFTADDAAPVTDLKAQITPSIAGHSSVTITANGQNTSVSLTKPVYGGAVDVTTGVVTETHGGGAYNPTGVPTDLSSKIVSATTERSASGSVASFNCTLGEYPMSALTAAINPVQDLHGYDSPWPAGGGKNKAYWPTLTNPSSGGVHYTILDDGNTLHVEGTASANSAAWDGSLSNIYANMPLGPYPAGTYTIIATGLVGQNANDRIMFTARYADGTIVKEERISGLPGVIPDGTGAAVTFTATNEFKIGLWMNISSGASVNCDAKIQLEKASSLGTWEPYSNVCPITGWTECKVTRTGFNVWDEEWENGYLSNNGVFISDPSSVCSKNYIPIRQSESFFGECPSGKSLRICAYKEDKTFISLKSVTNAAFTLPAETAYIKFSVFGYGTTYNNNISINYPATDTQYHPYAGNTYTIQLGDTVWGGTLDVTSGKLTVDRAMLGNVTWTKHDSYSHVFFAPGGTGQLVSSTTSVSNVCVLYSGGNLSSFASNSEYRFRISDRIYINIPSVSNVTDLNTWITNNSLQICYELATPIEIQLDPVTISTISGQTNNVWADCGPVTVSYRDGLLSNVSGIMTNSTALTAGENITYTLSQERTFQIPGTVIRTVVGNNVMSASTGNISVTWSSHWFDITPWIAYQGLTFSRNDVDSPDAGRDMSGYMHRGRVGVKEKMNITTVQLTRAQSSTLQTLLYPETIQVRVTPYPRTNTSHTMSMYTNNVKTTYVIHRENGEDLQSLTFPLIEN